jgi:hypothetical protein
LTTRRFRQAVAWSALALDQYNVIASYSAARPEAIWWRIRQEAESILGAYVRGEAIPEPAALREYKEGLDDYFAQLSKSLSAASARMEQQVVATEAEATRVPQTRAT